MISPGPTNWAKGTPSTAGLAPRIATTKIIMYNKVVTTGASTVCIHTFQKRITSRR